MQDLAETPSSDIVHEPHWLVLQPTLVTEEPEVGATEVDQQEAGLDSYVAAAAVNRGTDWYWCPLCLP